MVKVYGADWCPDTIKANNYLDTLGVNYQYINVEKDAEASQWVKDQNNGKEKKPTITIGEKTLTTPSETELDSELRKIGFIS